MRYQVCASIVGRIYACLPLRLLQLISCIKGGMEQLHKLASKVTSNTVRIHKQYIESQPMELLRQSDVPKKPEPRRQNNKGDDQKVIEKRLVQQLGDQYAHAELIEISRGSYLIQNNVRLPIYGRSPPRLERNKQSISKRGYLVMRDKE